MSNLFLIAVTASVLCFASECSYSTAEDRPVLPGVGEKMREFVASKEIAGAVTLVTDRDRVIHLDACGMADIAGSQQMKTDSIFWIASMTKPITGTAVMMMQEEGK